MIRLDAIEFEGTPTPSQMANMLEEINKFVNKAVGLIMSAGDAQATDPKVAVTLNGCIAFKQGADHFRGSSNIAQPQLVPRQAVQH